MTTDKKQAFEAKAPILEVKYSLSKDGKWFITKTIITDIKSVNYMKAVLDKPAPSTEASQ